MDDQLAASYSSGKHHGLPVPLLMTPERCTSWGRDMMGDMHEQLSGVDILVNNAGIQYVSAVHEFPDDKW